ncbi:MAG: tRNA1(Val) (adenine(37)-N6)-methyltransferase [Deltaproteobacteria bacterium]|jgi:tRNA1Val (adenine37-N6)-methyltransferase|nr:tRNA1(Val) (adenine(37)-N6)-methyltransferase [Deltaproteobacteria bacterium]MBW2487934.1 tRNA1(Val) (adenine(37)-N6)-methyltransferase [Deltaproteobacteria bacterium]
MNRQTTGTFFDGKLLVKQDPSGYRFSIDAILLASYARPRAKERVLDLGTGCGIIPLILAYRHPNITAIGIEIQKELAQMAIANVEANLLQNQIRVLCQDMRRLKPDDIGGPVDLVVCNPPFHKPESGRVNPDRQRAIARHELKINLADILKTAKRMLRTAGRFVTIYTAERLTDLFVQMRAHGIEPKSMRAVHGQLASEARLILISGTKGAQPGTRLQPPVVIYDSKGVYSQEILQMFEP